LFCVAVAACGGTPTAYRPQIEVFAKATGETSQFARDLQATTTASTIVRQRETIERRKPHIAFDDAACAEAIIARTSRLPGQPLEPLQVAVNEKCAWIAGDDIELHDAFDTGSRLQASVSFLRAVEKYAAGLQLIATSADKAGLVEATRGTVSAVASLATTATSLAQEKPEKAPDLGAVSTLIGTIAFHVLEEMRGEALKQSAREADKWIAEGSAAVARVLEEANNELIRMANARKNRLVDAANGAKGAPDYVVKVQAAQAAQIELEQLVGRDPTAPLLKLAKAHRALLASFDDPNLQVGPAIVAALDLMDATQNARTALDKGELKGTKK
jgi:hypothetical protein